MKCYAKIISVLVCTLLGSTIAVAQQSKNIYVVAKESGNAIPLATIVLNCNGKQKIVCDANGVATIATHQHTCEATISANGYEPLFTVLNTDTFFLQRKNVALQELVITGQPQKIAAEKSLYKVFTISERALKQQAAITLGDAMNNELGFYRQQDNLLGSATNLGGIGGQNIKILVNGVPVNGRENGNIDLNQVNVANAERIEIVKGPMSVLYGTDALGGVVNVITKQAKPGRQISFIGYAESINKVNTGLEMSAQKGKHSIYLNAHRNFFGGYTFTDSFNRAQLWKPKTQYTADITYSLQLKKLRLSYTPNFMWERIVNKGTPVVDPFNAFANDEHITTRRLSQVVNAELTVDSNTRITFNNSVSIYNRLRTMHAMDLANEESINAPQRTGLDTSNFVDFNFRSIGASRLDKNTSIFYGYDVNIQTATSLKLLSKSQNMSDYAVFASVPFQVTSKLQIQPAIRLSYNTKYYVPVTPSFNLKLDLPRKSILRASYAQGFRAPSLKELYLNFIDINHNVQGKHRIAVVCEYTRPHQLYLRILL
jgi:outer membrane receptor for ferrienterochelin and colicins